MNAFNLAVDPLALDDLVPPATLAEARAFRDDLSRLLGRERAAAADFLVALADFDRRRGWERLGHASLFAFLTRELGLSKGGAFFRLTAARLVLRFPEVVEPLRDGRLCVTSVVELARVVTPENRAEVLPRFYGCSSREAKEVAAALDPRSVPPRREVVTTFLCPASAPMALALAPSVAQPERLPESKLPNGAVQSTEPHLPPAPTPRAEVQPLTADLRRLHVTVTARFLDKVAAARDGLSHALPDATMEQVLEAALDLLLERQARAKALVRRPRAIPTPIPTPTKARPHIPAAVEREVRVRDGNRCQFPLDAGGACNSTWQVELDHIVPLALGGETVVANLRCACRRHNQAAAVEALGHRASSSAKWRRRGR